MENKTCKTVNNFGQQNHEYYFSSTSHVAGRSLENRVRMGKSSGLRTAVCLCEVDVSWVSLPEEKYRSCSRKKERRDENRLKKSLALMELNWFSSWSPRLWPRIRRINEPETRKIKWVGDTYEPGALWYSSGTNHGMAWHYTTRYGRARHGTAKKLEILEILLPESFLTKELCCSISYGP